MNINLISTQSNSEIVFKYAKKIKNQEESKTFPQLYFCCIDEEKFMF